jgi:hypothetical protein
MNSIKRLMILVVMVFSLVMLSSFVFTVNSGAREVIESYPPLPPPARMEEPPVAPAPINTPGHWEWNGHEYIWVHRQLVESPYPNAVWVPSHWEWNGYEWISIPGHWE